ncbi:HAMP domain-containing histidine kinase [Pikeienuella piscinae]|uniref:histidine kinase n=1 Tax=Pikeienuella piscinae TaxID=2748098 RepID=A0A7L5BWL8_9RHOB|nr:HAMP domain-containing sensor histidine kinase [Pikeienuella piscinae]QIE55831.1 HAMP domain-containing histidine kinase [Pikeienuella piscinae]
MNAAGAQPEFIWDPERLRLVWANSDGLAFWGEESLIDLTERVFAPGDETARALAARIAEIGEGGDGAGRLALNPRGAPVWARAATTLERGADGRLRLRVALSEVEPPDDRLLALMRAGFDAAPQPLAIFSETGALLARNEADRRGFAAGPGGFVERYVDPAEGRNALAATLSGGAYSRKSETMGAGGPSRHRVSLRRMSDPSTGALAVIAEFQDLSDRPAPTRAEATSTASDIAKLAHDLRSPLTAIEGFAEFIAMAGDEMSAERRAGYLDDIRTASRRMLALVEEIVALGAPGTDPAALRGSGCGPVDLRALAEEIARLHAPEAAAAGVTLSVEGDSHVEPECDAASLQRILGNLVSNALEHGRRPGGAVRVSLDRGANAIEVADDGPGMSAEALAAALRPYGREAGAGGRTGGLGLSNAKALAAAIGARLQIRTAPGEGFAARLVFRAG